MECIRLDYCHLRGMQFRFFKSSLCCETKHGQGDSVTNQALDLNGNTNADTMLIELRLFLGTENNVQNTVHFHSIILCCPSEYTGCTCKFFTGNTASLCLELNTV